MPLVILAVPVSVAGAPGAPGVWVADEVPRSVPAAWKTFPTLTAHPSERMVPAMRHNVSSGSPLEPTIGFSRAVRVGSQIFVATTAAIWPDGHVDSDVAAQARRCLEIIEDALREAGAALTDVVRTRVFLTDPAHGESVAAVHGETFGSIRPASGFIVVRGFLDPRWLVEIEADAVVTDRSGPVA